MNSQTTLINYGDNWSYYDNGNQPSPSSGLEWNEVAYDDGTWSSGNAHLGYGDNDETTTISSATLTGYFRHEFNVTNPSNFDFLDLNLIYDDGAVVYLNGTEVWRQNMPAGVITYNTFTPTQSSDNAFATQSITSALVSGTNVIAVEVHQRSAGSSDLSFDFELEALSAGNIRVIRGPYLQKGTPTSMVVKWRTDQPTQSVIHYGTNQANLNQISTDNTLKTEHELEITGLNPFTKYYYDVSNTSGVLIPGAVDIYWTTSPNHGTIQPVKAWILGDPGTANNNQRAVRDAYYNHIGANHTDMILFLGDNAYSSGTDAEYQNAMFQNMYEDKLKNTVAWSTLGNHDGYTANSQNQSGPYYDIFTFPTAGEAGGLASGTEAYYSFDYANIHFIVLESYETNRSVGGTMYNWAQNDIQNTTQEWIVAMWHHPPYTKGSHNSDTETPLIEMRQNFLPMLESNGIDLVLSGHSHSYERSYYLNGHYGNANSFNAAEHIVGINGGGNGKLDGDGNYQKLCNEGTVYITAGSSGKTSNGNLNHNAMFYSVADLGSCLLEVNGDQLDVKFLRETGAIDDYFTIVKDNTSQPSCDDNDCTTADSYDTNTCECINTPITPPSCDDNDCSTTDSYDTNTCQCVYTTISGANCVLTPGAVRVDATFENIGINYSVSGDDNLNSTFQLRYRVQGSSTWKDGAMSMRAHPSLVVDGSPLNMNYHAASAMYLQPNTTYEIQLVLTDPDGGSTTTTITQKTKAIPQPNLSSIKYVSPGSGGGSGTIADPYLGLQAAANAANAGDHFIVGPGTYDPFVITKSGTQSAPISFLSEVRHCAVIEGNNTDRHVVNIGDFSTITSHVIIDGFTIQNGKWGIDAQNTQFVTVRNNIIQDVGYGYYNRREFGNEKDQYITNNEIYGRTAWPGSGIPKERGIDVRGNNNVISCNTIQNFGDGISTDGPPYQLIYSIDIHNNDVKNVVDDLVEIDWLASNGRVYANRLYNGRAGVSVAPVFGGPAYVVRNEIFNLEYSGIKMNRGSSGLVIVNNTVVSSGSALSSSIGWQNTFYRNNVVFSEEYCFQEYGLITGSIDDWDYDAFYSARSGTTNNEWFKWDDIRYANVPILSATGLIEANAIAVSPSHFNNITLPSAWNIEYDPNQRDLSPKSGSPVVNAGVQLDNINEPFSSGQADRGALEFGKSAPKYGATFDPITPPSCEDNDCTTTDSYDTTICECVNTPIAPPSCEDNDCTTTDSYDTTTCECVNTPIVPPSCEDNDCTTTDSYDTTTCECVNTSIAPPSCEDNDCTTTDSYDTTTCECVNTPIAPPSCEDNDCTTVDSYDTTTCECVNTPIIDLSCDDGDENTYNDEVQANCDCLGLMPTITIVNPGDSSLVCKDLYFSVMIDNWDVGIDTSSYNYYLDSIFIGSAFDLDTIDLMDMSVGQHLLGVELVDESGMEIGVSDEIIFSVGELPINAGEDMTICKGESIALIASGADSYLWSQGDTVDSISVAPLLTTTYVVVGEDILGCAGEDTVTVFVEETSIIGDFVWNDKNANGCQDDNEKGLNGIEVKLIENGVVVQSTITANDPVNNRKGWYEFISCPGEYTIRFGKHVRKQLTIQENCNDDLIDSDPYYQSRETELFTLVGGNDIFDIDAGYYPYGRIKGRCWIDADINGIQDQIEQDFQGLLVKLFAITGGIALRSSSVAPIATTLTDINGEFEFNDLLLGEYFIEAEVSPGYNFTLQNTDPQDSLDSDVHQLTGQSVTVNVDSIILSEFDLDIGLNSIVLPLDILSFEVINNVRDVFVNWVTTNEQNVDYFIVERRFEQEELFESIARVEAKAIQNVSENYSANDIIAGSVGLYFYRLKIFDKDGSYYYSDIESISIREDSKDKFNVFPNPALDEVYISGIDSEDSSLAINIYNRVGQLVSKKFEVNSGVAKIVMRDLAAGIYIVQVSQNNLTFHYKVVKE